MDKEIMVDGKPTGVILHDDGKITVWGLNGVSPEVRAELDMELAGMENEQLG